MMRSCLWSPATNLSAVQAVLRTDTKSLERARFDGADGQTQWCSADGSAGSYSRRLSPLACASLPCDKSGNLDSGTHRSSRHV